MLFSKNKEHTWWKCRVRLDVSGTVTNPTKRRRKHGSRKGGVLAVKHSRSGCHSIGAAFGYANTRSQTKRAEQTADPLLSSALTSHVHTSAAAVAKTWSWNKTGAQHAHVNTIEFLNVMDSTQSAN